MANCVPFQRNLVGRRGGRPVSVGGGAGDDVALVEVYGENSSADVTAPFGGTTGQVSEGSFDSGRRLGIDPSSLLAAGFFENG